MRFSGLGAVFLLGTSLASLSEPSDPGVSFLRRLFGPALSLEVRFAPRESRLDFCGFGRLGCAIFFLEGGGGEGIEDGFSPLALPTAWLSWRACQPNARNLGIQNSKTRTTSD